jgi:hypothetical protein
LERLLRERPPTALNARTRWGVVLHEEERGEPCLLALERSH